MVVNLTCCILSLSLLIYLFIRLCLFKWESMTFSSLFFPFCLIAEEEPEELSNFWVSSYVFVSVF